MDRNHSRLSKTVTKHKFEFTADHDSLFLFFHDVVKFRAPFQYNKLGGGEGGEEGGVDKREQSFVRSCFENKCKISFGISVFGRFQYKTIRRKMQGSIATNKQGSEGARDQTNKPMK